LGGEALVAGSSVEIRWALLPEDVEEMELLLSIDGLDAASIRLTPRMDPRAGSFRWDVPRIAAAAARLRIRYGQDGRETDGEPGETFSIALSPCLGTSPLLHRDGEFWVAPDDCLPSTALGFDGLVMVAPRQGSDRPAIPRTARGRLGVLSPSGRFASAQRARIDGARDRPVGPRGVSAGIIPARE
jgi:hypothetical protein